jgi:hypothetical protein
MELNDALKAHREAVLDRWFQVALATYPADAARFLASDANRFSNPVGHTVRESLSRVYDGLAGAPDPAALAAAVDGMVRIRAVQEFSPSGAIGFVFALRQILREELAEAGLAPADLALLDAAVDRAALAAFDVYMQCREKIFDIRVREIRSVQTVAARHGA